CHLHPFGISARDQLEAEIDVTGLQKHPIQTVDALTDDVLADHVLPALQQQRGCDRRADLARDGEVGIPRVHAVVQRGCLLPPPEFPFVYNERRLGEGGGGREQASQQGIGDRTSEGCAEARCRAPRTRVTPGPRLVPGSSPARGQNRIGASPYVDVTEGDLAHPTIPPLNPAMRTPTALSRRPGS